MGQTVECTQVTNKIGGGYSWMAEHLKGKWIVILGYAEKRKDKHSSQK